MRIASLLGIILSELLIIALFVWNISASSLSLISTMVVVVVFAFAASALLRNIKSMKLTKNYGISGIIGIIVGIIYYIWAADNLESMVLWLRDVGIYFLFLFILLCALYLFLSNKKGNQEIETGS